MPVIDDAAEAADKLQQARPFARATAQRSLRILLVPLVASQCGVLAYAASSHTVAQRNRAFGVREISVKADDTIKFSNEDQFLHQIFIASPALNFDSAEQAPGQTIEVRFPTSGSFEVLCHIHPKMRLAVTVQ
jgi:plastocyanin